MVLQCPVIYEFSKKVILFKYKEVKQRIKSNNKEKRNALVCLKNQKSKDEKVRIK